VQTGKIFQNISRASFSETTPCQDGDGSSADAIRSR
jgi:hypothetical protein